MQFLQVNECQQTATLSITHKFSCCQFQGVLVRYEVPILVIFRGFMSRIGMNLLFVQHYSY